MCGTFEMLNIHVPHDSRVFHLTSLQPTLLSTLFEQSSSWELSENTPLNVAFSQTEKQDKCCATLTLIYVNSEISPFEFYKNFVSSPGYWCIWVCLFQRDPFKWQLGHICFAESILSQIWKIGVCGTTLDSKAQRKDQSQVLYNIYLIWNFKLNLC